MIDYVKALEEAKKMDPAVVEVVRQQVEAALEQGMTWAEFAEGVAYARQG